VRLLLIIEDFSARTGGAEGFAVAVFRRLAQRGHDVHVLTRNGAPLPDITLHSAASQPDATRVARELRPDVRIDWGLTAPADLHRLGGGVHAEFLRFNRLRRKGPMLLAKLLEEQLPKHRRILARERRLLEAPDTHVLAVSQFVAQQVRRVSTLPDERITVLLNGVDIERFRPPRDEAERRETRQRIGIAPDQTAFLFVGHNLGLKNLDLITGIFGRLAASVPGARLLVVGKRRPRRTCPQLCCLGTTARIEEVYRAADVLVHPSYYDACANAVLEALASGLPVVSSRYNGSAEIITPEKEGFVLPVAHQPPAEIQQVWLTALLRLGRNRRLRQEMGRRARELAELHSIDAYTDAFENLLDRIARRSRAIGADTRAERDLEQEHE